ncbi:MAG: DUF294 nucleotidyltransferase-like domain-containing protein [Pseudomonadota bacterium]
MSLLREIEPFLAQRHPYDTLSPEDRRVIAGKMISMDIAAGGQIYEAGQPLDGLYLIERGQVEVTDANGVTVSLLGPGNSFGERGLIIDGIAVTSAKAAEGSHLFLLPREDFDTARKTHPSFNRFFDRRRQPDAEPQRNAVHSKKVADLMTANPISLPPKASIREAAELMRDRRISALPITDEGTLKGIVTVHDMTNRVLAEGFDTARPVSDVMTRQVRSLPPDALGLDALLMMAENRHAHVPIVQGESVVGIVSQTDLIQTQAVTANAMVGRIVRAPSSDAMIATVKEIPQLLATLVGSGTRHEIVTRMITDIGDAVTRRLLALGEEQLGAPPAPYVWLACGSQGRQEQTGVSDQDNCLILDDRVRAEDMPYFTKLAKFVSDGLDACGYFYCPGDMMATNPQWCQPKKVWREYFVKWITSPGPEAQMLASVMFDLRVISGKAELFETLRAETLAVAQSNSIFVSHMVANSLKHTPPLGLFRGFAMVKSGEHRNTVDLKHNGVVPIVDLGRVYALQSADTAVNTYTRVNNAVEGGLVSASGGRDLVDAYDLIADTRLRHQTKQIRRGEKPDNFMAPSTLSELERSHLRDAFVVVKTMQSALGQGRGHLS